MKKDTLVPAHHDTSDSESNTAAPKAESPDRNGGIVILWLILMKSDYHGLRILYSSSCVLFHDSLPRRKRNNMNTFFLKKRLLYEHFMQLPLKSVCTLQNTRRTFRLFHRRVFQSLFQLPHQAPVRTHNTPHQYQRLL